MALSLGGCASLKGPGSPGQKLDPWENWNRKVFGFNEKIDENVLKPVATAYSEAGAGAGPTGCG
ncbi:VacJ family lipoprotein [Paucibacter sp. O1-1]|nr:VacJ family lipoprotein [Paucibacter sp. O1-1]MDA3828545.1 VacJ family lipoprotein [Paucibacter sp. O1-1]